MNKLLCALMMISFASVTWAANLDQLSLDERYKTIESLFKSGSPISVENVANAHPKFKYLMNNEESGRVQALNNLLNNVDIKISQKFFQPGSYSVSLRYIFEQDPYDKPFVVINFNAAGDISKLETQSNEATVKNLGWGSTLPPWYQTQDILTFKTASLDGKNYLLVSFGLNMFGYSEL